MGLYSKNKGNQLDINTGIQDKLEKKILFMEDISKHLVTEILIRSGCQADVVDNEILFNQDTKVVLNGTTLEFYGRKSNGLNMNFNGNGNTITINGQNISIDGNVVINGDFPGGSVSSEEDKDNVRKLSLDDYNLKLVSIKITGQSSFSAIGDKDEFKNLRRIKLSGQSRLNLNNVSLNNSLYIQLSGQSTASFYLFNGPEIEIDCSGQSNFTATESDFLSITKSMCGQSNIRV